MANQKLKQTGYDMLARVFPRLEPAALSYFLCVVIGRLVDVVFCDWLINCCLLLWHWIENSHIDI